MMSSPRTSTAPTGTSPAAPAATASASADRMKTLSRPPSGAIMRLVGARLGGREKQRRIDEGRVQRHAEVRSEEHTSELQSRGHLVCRLLLEKKKKKKNNT